jgi:hypothetical protein
MKSMWMLEELATGERGKKGRDGEVKRREGEKEGREREAFILCPSGSHRD